MKQSTAHLIQTSRQSRPPASLKLPAGPKMRIAGGLGIPEKTHAGTLDEPPGSSVPVHRHSTTTIMPQNSARCRGGSYYAWIWELPKSSPKHIAAKKSTVEPAPKTFLFRATTQNPRPNRQDTSQPPHWETLAPPRIL